MSETKTETISMNPDPKPSTTETSNPSFINNENKPCNVNVQFDLKFEKPEKKSKTKSKDVFLSLPQEAQVDLVNMKFEFWNSQLKSKVFILNQLMKDCFELEDEIKFTYIENATRTDVKDALVEFKPLSVKPTDEGLVLIQKFDHASQYFKFLENEIHQWQAKKTNLQKRIGLLQTQQLLNQVLPSFAGLETLTPSTESLDKKQEEKTLSAAPTPSFESKIDGAPTPASNNKPQPEIEEKKKSIQKAILEFVKAKNPNLKVDENPQVLILEC